MRDSYVAGRDGVGRGRGDPYDGVRPDRVQGEHSMVRCLWWDPAPVDGGAPQSEVILLPAPPGGFRQVMGGLDVVCRFEINSPSILTVRW